MYEFQLFCVFIWLFCSRDWTRDLNVVSLYLLTPWIWFSQHPVISRGKLQKCSFWSVEYWCRCLFQKWIYDAFMASQACFSTPAFWSPMFCPCTIETKFFLRQSLSWYTVDSKMCRLVLSRFFDIRGDIRNVNLHLEVQI